LNFTPGTKGGIDVKALKDSLIELPQARRRRFIEEYELSTENAKTLTDDKNLADFFEQAMSELRAWLIALGELEGTEEEIWDKGKAKLAKLTANWLTNKLIALIYKDGKDIVEIINITPENFAEFVTLMHQNKINSTIGQKLLEKMYQTGKDPSVIMDEEDLTKGADEVDLKKIISQVIADNPKQIELYKKGKTTVIQYFIGQVMRQTKGRADPNVIKELLEKELS
jgi:aspartyl-tRNA(Asn)/glutamyl-tRNA(Gln) amidotransferase subunit B